MVHSHVLESTMSKALTKAELIAYIEKNLPDDAKVLGYSNMAGEIFSLEEDNNIPVFTPIEEYFEEDEPEFDGATHLLEQV